MKKLFLLTLLALAMLAACDKKQPSPAAPESNTEMRAKKTQQQTADTTAADTLQQLSETDSVPQGIAGIKEAWREQTISFEAATVNIQNLALAFCEKYPGFDPNRALRDHLSGKEKLTEGQEYAVNLEARNGYVCIETTTELPTGSTLCYWNRKNGHKLLAVWMEKQEEGQKAEKLLLFYDYDPNTKTLKPEPKLTDELERITRKFPDWSLRLPAEGKDIEIMAFSKPDSSGNFETTYYTWKWNGQSFRFDPNGHE